MQLALQAYDKERSSQTCGCFCLFFCFRLAQVSPSFAKRYANVGREIQQGLNAYRKDVTAEVFPGTEYSPYKMKDDEERAKFKQWSEDKLRELGRDKLIDKDVASSGGNKNSEQGASITPADETIKVY